MKKLYCLILALALLLVACGGTVSKDENESNLIFSSQAADESDGFSSLQESSNGNSSADSLSEEPSDNPSEDRSDEPSEDISFEDSSSEVPPQDVSQDFSDDPSEETSTPTDDPSVDDPSEEPEDYTSISSVNRMDVASNLAIGKSYTTSYAADPKYPDDGTLLTDGKVSNSFNADKWAGYIRSSYMSIVLDLGKVEDNLADFYVSTLRKTEYGIGSPAYVLFEISNDGKTYRKLGKAYPPSDVNKDYYFEYRINLKETVSARYVRMSFGSVDSSWLFLGEIAVVRYVSDEYADLYYGDRLPIASDSDYWPTQQQSDTKINLILGKKPYVESEEPVVLNFATEYYNSILALPRLTDNKFGIKPTYSDDALAHFTRAEGRIVSFDFGYLSAVTGMKYSFLNEDSTGVHPPNELCLYLSDDGAEWELVSTVNIRPDGKSSYCRGEVSFEKTYIARYAKFVFAVGSHVFCDELQVLGTKRIPSNAVEIVPTPDEAPSQEIGYVTPDQFLGVNNVMLSYHCLFEDGKHSEPGLITVEEYLPYVGYYDTDGQLKDTFFDAFLYLPYTKFNYDDVSHTLNGWKFYLDDIYYPDRNMDALNKAVAQVKQELALPNYKCTVFTSILYTWTNMADGSLNAFGDVDGDGRSDAFSSVENRKKAIKWLIDQEYSRFLQKGYDNLAFGGFYWFEEAVSVYNDDERALIKFASDYVHSLGLKLFWIPYYCATGYDQWQELGFDVACMQPNYMFGNSGSSEVLKLTADKTRMLGMCVEIEMNSVENPDEIRRYMQYLEAGEKYGYMHAVKMYYQGGVPGAFYQSYLSEEPAKRSVYDMTYLFAKEKFESTPPSCKILKTEFTTTGGAFDSTKIYEAQGVFTPVLSVSPQHGDLRLNLDGTFSYYPEGGFIGEDQFAIYLDYAFSRTKEIVITIQVG